MHRGISAGFRLSYLRDTPCTVIALRERNRYVNVREALRTLLPRYENLISKQ